MKMEHICKLTPLDPRYCLNSCIFCTQDTEFRPLPNTNRLRSFTHMKDTIDALEGLDVHKVIIAGADPCQLGDELIQLIEYIYSKGLEIKNIQTHARTFVDRNLVKSLQKVNRGFSVIVPLYGSTSEIHDKVVRSRIGDAFQEAITGIENCSSIGIPIRVNTRILRSNFDDIENIVDLSHKLHAQKVYIGWISGLQNDLTEEEAFKRKSDVIKSHPDYVIDVDTSKRYGPNIILNTRIVE